MVGSDFKMLGSGSTHDIISASALGASSWIQEPRHKLMHILVIIVVMNLLRWNIRKKLWCKVKFKILLIKSWFVFLCSFYTISLKVETENQYNRSIFKI